MQRYSALPRLVSSAAILVIVMPLGMTTVYADSVCEQGIRETTTAERATVTSVLEAVKSALPAAPQGWIIEGDDQISVPANLCLDFERDIWIYPFGRSYQRIDDFGARQAVIGQAADNAQSDLATKQPRLDAIMAKMQTLTQQQVTLVEKGAMDQATALNEEMAALQNQYQQIIEEGPAQQQTAVLLQEASRDQTYNIDVTVNSQTAVADPRATQLDPPKGAMAAYEWNTIGENGTQGHALILLGQWETVAPGKAQRPALPDLPPEAARVIVVHVSADPGRLNSVVEGINFPALAKLVL